MKQKKTEVVPGASARYSGSMKSKQQHEWQAAVDAVFAELESKGIVARHDLANYQSCGLDAIDHHILGFSKRGGTPIGYTFYHAQDTINVADKGELIVSYGSVDGGRKQSIDIGKVVRDTFIARGFPVRWNESIFRRIAIWVQGPVPDGYSSVDTSEALPGFQTDMHIERFIESAMLQQGFARVPDRELVDPDLMAFSSDYPMLLIAWFDTSGITLQCGMTFPETQNLNKLKYAVARLNDITHVMEITITEDRTVIMTGKLNIRSIQSKLDHFIQMFTGDLDEFFSHAKAPPH